MFIEFFESDIPYDKTVKAHVITEYGDHRMFTFGKDFSRAHMIDSINRMIREGKKRRSRKAEI